MGRTLSHHFRWVSGRLDHANTGSLPPTDTAPSFFPHGSQSLLFSSHPSPAAKSTFFRIISRDLVSDGRVSRLQGPGWSAVQAWGPSHSHGLRTLLVTLHVLNKKRNITQVAQFFFHPLSPEATKISGRGLEDRKSTQSCHLLLGRKIQAESKVKIKRH